MPPYVNVTSRDYLWVSDCFVQVADSFVGRWFKLEGSGAANERQGSRFLVCPLPLPSLAPHRSQVAPQTELRAGLTTWVCTTRNTDICPVVNN